MWRRRSGPAMPGQGAARMAGPVEDRSRRPLRRARSPRSSAARRGYETSPAVLRCGAGAARPRRALVGLIAARIIPSRRRPSGRRRCTSAPAKNTMIVGRMVSVMKASTSCQSVRIFAPIDHHARAARGYCASELSRISGRR